MPLSEESLLRLLDLVDVCPAGLGEEEVKYLHAYTIQAIKSGNFEGYMRVVASGCSRLMAKCLNNTNYLLTEDAVLREFEAIVQ